MGLGEHHLTAIRRMLARAAVGPSTVRNQGVPGVAVAARSFLVEVELDRFSTSDPTAFAAELESQTLELVAALPTKARSWGLARKCLNIFLIYYFPSASRGATNSRRARALNSRPSTLDARRRHYATRTTPFGCGAAALRAED
ncbi:MAG: hypothetical protein QME96_01515 [Myxococcota bacterium]|nr:hypothetical protein [Myxococcota bacterium]